MSTEKKLKRFILVEISGEQWMHEKENRMTPANPGEFVRWEDYSILKAEVERLQQEKNELAAMIHPVSLKGWIHTKGRNAAKEGKPSV